MFNHSVLIKNINNKITNKVNILLNILQDGALQIL